MDLRPPIALPEGVCLRDEYSVGAVLGAGSFGITYRAHDRHLDTSVAIKEYFSRHLAGRSRDDITVRPHSSSDEESFAYGLKRFMEEGRLLARFDRPNIVRVHSYFEDHGTGYLVMDYYEGQTLSERLASESGTLPEAEAVTVVQSVLRGLQPVHEEGVLHRDIDPQNMYQPVDGPAAILINFWGGPQSNRRAQSKSVCGAEAGVRPLRAVSRRGCTGPVDRRIRVCGNLVSMSHGNPSRRGHPTNRE